jgi:hypothetical protein
MPLEGHWERQHSPLRPPTTRGGWVFLAVAAALAVAAVVLLAYAIAGGSGAGRTAAGCIDVTAASSTGGARVHACGAAARRWCRAAAAQDTPLARAIRPQCRRIR